MKLGFLTACMPERSLEEIARWAGENGFEALELVGKTFLDAGDLVVVEGPTYLGVDALEPGALAEERGHRAGARAQRSRRASEGVIEESPMRGLRISTPSNR